MYLYCNTCVRRAPSGMACSVTRNTGVVRITRLGCVGRRQRTIRYLRRSCTFGPVRARQSDRKRGYRASDEAWSYRLPDACASLQSQALKSPGPVQHHSMASTVDGCRMADRQSRMRSMSVLGARGPSRCSHLPSGSQQLRRAHVAPHDGLTDHAGEHERRRARRRHEVDELLGLAERHVQPSIAHPDLHP